MSLNALSGLDVTLERKHGWCEEVCYIVVLSLSRVLGGIGGRDSPFFFFFLLSENVPALEIYIFSKINVIKWKGSSSKHSHHEVFICSSKTPQCMANMH